jgi:hypothetical protein
MACLKLKSAFAFGACCLGKLTVDRIHLGFGHVEHDNAHGLYLGLFGPSVALATQDKVAEVGEPLAWVVLPLNRRGRYSRSMPMRP